MNDAFVRRLILLVAAVSLGIGVVVFVATDWVLDRLSYEFVLGLEVFGRLFFYLALLVLLAQSYRIARERYGTPIDEATPPPREAATGVPTPGDDLARAVGSVRGRSDSAYREVQRRIDGQLRRVLGTTGDRSDADASRAVADGTWTDDDVAAAVLDDGDAPPRSLGDRLLAALGVTGLRAQRELRRTMMAATAVAGTRADSRRTAPSSRDPADGTVDEDGDEDEDENGNGNGNEPPSGVDGDDASEEEDGDAEDAESTVAVDDGDDGEDGDDTGDTADSNDVGDTDDQAIEDTDTIDVDKSGDDPRTADDPGPDEDSETDPNGERRIERRRTGHWNGVSAVALVGIVLGVLYQQPPVIVAATAGIGFAAYARLGDDPDPELAVTVDRAVSDPDPDPGDDVDVTVTVRNDGERRLHDLRVVDGVPSEVPVASGSPRIGTTLAPDETTSIRYTITARRGTYRFDQVQLLVRHVTGAGEMDVRVPAATETPITCVPPIRPLSSSAELPLQTRGSQRAGRLATADPGPGVEFHSVREYRSGDPVQRIDWNRYARSGTLTTVSFRDERSAVVIVAIDARNAAYLAPEGSHTEHAVDRAASGAADTFGSLLAAGHRAGLASIGPDPLWLAPDGGRDHRERGRTLLGTDDAIGSRPPATAEYELDQFDRATASTAQVVLFTPLCDDDSLEIVRTLRSKGFPVTVVSPDPTSTDGPERAIARVDRELRIATLRARDVPVVDWAWDDAFDRALRGES